MAPKTAKRVSERPLRADAERNRVRLLDAATELFAEKGLSVGLDEIARHAGVGVGTAYRRFPDKDKLVEAMFDRRIGQLVGFAEDGLRADDPWEGFATFIEKAAGLHARDRGLKEALFTRPDRARRVAIARERVGPLGEQLVRRAQESGQLRRDVSNLDVPLMHFMLGSLGELAGDHPFLLNRYVQIVLDGLRTPDPSPLPGTTLAPEDFDRTFGSGFARRD